MPGFLLLNPVQGFSVGPAYVLFGLVWASACRKKLFQGRPRFFGEFVRGNHFGRGKLWRFSVCPGPWVLFRRLRFFFFCPVLFFLKISALWDGEKKTGVSGLIFKETPLLAIPVASKPMFLPISENEGILAPPKSGPRGSGQNFGPFPRKGRNQRPKGVHKPCHGPTNRREAFYRVVYMGFPVRRIIWDPIEPQKPARRNAGDFVLFGMFGAPINGKAGALLFNHRRLSRAFSRPLQAFAARGKACRGIYHIRFGAKADFPFGKGRGDQHWGGLVGGHFRRERDCPAHPGGRPGFIAADPAPQFAFIRTKGGPCWAGPQTIPAVFLLPGTFVVSGRGCGLGPINGFVKIS